MASLSLSQMREKVASAYPGAGWKYKVYHKMPDNQIIALYHKFVEDGTFDKRKKRNKIMRENEINSGKQITIFDWIKEKL